MGCIDLHVHTNFCDGDNSPEEMVRAAIDLKMRCIGFSAHAPMTMGVGYDMPLENTEVYIRTITELKEKYRDKIRILCGLEQDYFALVPEPERFDYRIGSVHHVPGGSGYVNVDMGEEGLVEGVQRCFGGDMYRLTEGYYRVMGSIAEHIAPDFIGHFDVVTKYNTNGHLFDEGDPRYLAAAENAMDRLIAAGLPFEINTGAISRGIRTVPYPSETLLRMLKEKGAKVFLSSDAHSTSSLCFQFDLWSAYAKDFGFTDLTPALACLR